MKETIVSIHVNEETKKITVTIKGEDTDIRGAFALLTTKVVKALKEEPGKFLTYVGIALALGEALDIVPGDKDKKEVKLNDDVV